MNVYIYASKSTGTLTEYLHVIVGKKKKKKKPKGKKNELNKVEKVTFRN